GGRFTIESSGVVKVANGALIDYETAPGHAYSITVHATSSDGTFSEETFSIAVTNVDEQAPTFSSGDTTTTLAENSGANQLVYTAAASDLPDSAGSSHNPVTYGLSGADAGYF